MEKKNYNLKDKVIVITGANAGIGKAAVIQLARLGATVVMACRSLEDGMQALEEVRFAANSFDVDLMQVDLSSQSSIRQFAAEFYNCYEKLNVLIHNAANFDLSLKSPVMTEDKLETVFATIHSGPFLMTNLLLDFLKASAPSRVVTVASKGLLSYPFLDIEFDNLNGERHFSAQYAYYHSKQAQVMFTFDLAEQLRGTGVSVHCIRVGNVAIAEDRLSHLPKWMQRLYDMKRKFSMPPEKMAETYVWLAADPAGIMQTGKYWDAPGVEVKANNNAYNKETQRRLWVLSELFTGSVEHDLD